MSGAKKLQSHTEAVAELDQLFLQIYADLAAETKRVAARATQQVFDLSQQYINKPANDLVKEFYNLYFGNDQVESLKQRVNDEVDDLVAQVQNQMAQGVQNIADFKLKETSSNKSERLGIAGLQKQLEGLITLEGGIQEKLLPALTAMQFEDAVNQRIDHMVKGWDLIIGCMTRDDFDKDELGEAIAATLTSQKEREIFYPQVLHRPPPAGADEGSVFLDFFNQE